MTIFQKIKQLQKKLKPELKKIASAIKKTKRADLTEMPDEERWALWREADSVEYRYLHIVYCMLKGRELTDIEPMSHNYESATEWMDRPNKLSMTRLKYTWNEHVKKETGLEFTEFPFDLEYLKNTEVPNA